MALRPAGGRYNGVWINDLKNGSTAFYINYRDENGKPIKKKVGVKTKQSNFTVKDAYDRLIEVKHLLSTGQEIPFKTQRNKKKFTLQTAWDDYYEWAKLNKKTYAKDEEYYRLHIAPAFATKELKSIKSKDVEDFKHSFASKGYAAQSVKHYIGLIRHIINHAIKNELIKNYANPISGGKVKLPTVDNARQSFLSKEQANILLEELKQYNNPQLYQLTVLLLYTGARFSEVASLTWNDVNFETGMIYFKSTKNGNSRWVTMNELVKNVIQDLYENKKSNLIITNTKGKQIERMLHSWQVVVDNIIDDNKEAHAKQRVTVHSLRHTHASWLAMAGLDILHIKEQLGHKTLDMTMRYAHLIANKRHEATELL